MVSFQAAWPPATPVSKAAPAPAAPGPKKIKKPAETKKTATKSEPRPPIRCRPDTHQDSNAAPAARPAVAASAQDSGLKTATKQSPESSASSSADEIIRQKVRIPEVVTVKDLSDKLNVKPIEVIKNF